MELQQIINNKITASVIQLTVTDEANKQKQALLLFNTEDEWFLNETVDAHEVLSRFAGNLMHSLEKDSRVREVRCQTFKVINGVAKKTVAFCPLVRVRNVLRSCNFNPDGSIEML
jgi:hypothetical protein